MKRSLYWLIGVIVVAVIFSGIAVWLVSTNEIPSAYAAEAQMTPTIADDSGVDTTTAFNIKFNGDVNANDVRKYLQVEPSIDFGVHQGSTNKEILIAPAEPLDPDTVYQFSLQTDGKPVKWAFQTKEPFVVSSSFPTDESVSVPVDTQIRLNFSYYALFDWQSYFSIEPQVGGHFEQTGRTVAFVPDKPLFYDTIYTVTVKAGLPLPGSEQTLQNDYIYRFETQKDPALSDEVWSINAQASVFSMLDIPQFDFSLSENRGRSKVYLSVYSFKDAQEYAQMINDNEQVYPDWSSKAGQFASIDTSTLNAVLWAEANPVKEDDSQSLSLPQTLPAGYYLLRVQYHNEVKQIPFVVSNLTVYAQPANNVVLFWVHDLSDGKAVKGANIEEYQGRAKVQTGTRGTALLNVSASASNTLKNIYIIQTKDQSLVIQGMQDKKSSVVQPVDSWQYLYFDKSVYQSQDTVYFWGIEKSYSGQMDNGIQSLRVRLYAPDDPQHMIVSRSVSLIDGTYSGTLQLPNLESGTYQVRVYADDTVLLERTIQVGSTIPPSQSTGTPPFNSRQADLYVCQADREDGYQTDTDFAVSLNHNGSVMSEQAQSYMFIEARKQILKSSVSDSPVYARTFTKADLPGLYVYGVYFDGQSYHAAVPATIQCQKKEFELSIAVTCDQTSYKPGDIAKVTVAVSDPKGNPVAATVNLSVVDEAAFQSSDQTVDFAADIYALPDGNGLNDYILSHYVSAEAITVQTQSANKQSSVSLTKSDTSPIKDALFFQSLTTDEKGLATVEIPLSDEITTWRITCHAMTQSGNELLLASQTGDLISTLPFYSEVVSNPVYLEGDSPIFYLRSYGEQATGKITYHINMQGPDGANEYYLTGKNGTSTALQLNTLLPGYYELSLSSSSEGGGVDNMMYRFQVLDSKLKTGMTVSEKLTEGLQPQGSNQDKTLLVFSGPHRAKVLSSLWKNVYLDGSRLEYRLASSLAKQQLEQYGQGDEANSSVIWPSWSQDTDLTQYQNSDGGIAAFPQGTSDLKLSVRAASIAKDMFYQEGLLQYFNGFLTCEQNVVRTEQILALSGLAALRQPVLQDLKNMLSRDDLTSEERIYLIWGLVQLKDVQTAKDYFTKFLHTQAITKDNTARIQASDGNAYDTASLTAWAAMIAAYCGMEHNYFALASFVDQYQYAQAFVLESVMSCDGILPQLYNETASFQYQLNDKSHKVDLDKKQDYLLQLLPEQLQTLAVSSVEGDVVYTSFYEGERDLSVNHKNVASLYRSYSQNKSVMKIEVKYTLAASLPAGYYQISDYVPCGLTLLSDNSDRLQIKGQEVNTVIYKSAQKIKSGAFSYYADVVTPGRFTVRPAILSLTGAGKILAIDSQHVIKVSK